MLGINMARRYKSRSWYYNELLIGFPIQCTKIAISEASINLTKLLWRTCIQLLRKLVFLFLLKIHHFAKRGFRLCFTITVPIFLLYDILNKLRKNKYSVIMSLIDLQENQHKILIYDIWYINIYINVSKVLD